MSGMSAWPWPWPLRECGGREDEGPVVVVVARRISFSVAIFSSSRFSRSLSEASVVDVCSSVVSFCSSSLTCRSLRSRKARWLVGWCVAVRMGCFDGVNEGRGIGDSRRSVLRFPSALRRGEVVLLFAAVVGILVMVQVQLKRPSVAG